MSINIDSSAILTLVNIVIWGSILNDIKFIKANKAFISKNIEDIPITCDSLPSESKIKELRCDGEIENELDYLCYCLDKLLVDGTKTALEFEDSVYCKIFDEMFKSFCVTKSSLDSVFKFLETGGQRKDLKPVFKKLSRAAHAELMFLNFDVATQRYKERYHHYSK